MSELAFRQLVDMLIYLTATRIDLSYVVSYISRVMTTPKEKHWVATKWVLKYVKGTLEFGILYNKSKDPRLVGFIDSNWVGSLND